MLLPEATYLTMTLITHRPRQLFEMAELQRTQSDQGDSSVILENISYRSRASSIISTGTKFSIQTMPQGHFHIDGGLDGSNPRSVTTRPASLYSVRSMAPSLPPYDGHQPVDALLSPSTQAGHLNALQTSANHELEISSSIGNDQEQPLTPSDPENALSMHYGRVVRTIDENHARQLARIYSDHEQDLAATRDAVYQAYRREWKAKNREIERVREEAANEIEQVRKEALADVAALRVEIETLSATNKDALARIQKENADRLILLNEEHQAAVDKARNAIEDLWEGRWNDRIKVAAEETKRAAKEAERREQGKDEEWLRVIKIHHPELVGEIKDAVDLFRTYVSELNDAGDSAIV